MSCVLVVDDEPELRHLVADFLLDEGFIVRTAANGAQAMRELDGHRPSAVVLDLIMPLVDGWEFLQLCRARPDGASLPIIVVSSTPADRTRVAEFGAIAFLRKPVALDDLAALVRQAVGPPAAQGMDSNGPVAP